MVVWDAIRTAMKPEKKIWTAEIEIYRLVISKGSYGTARYNKKNTIVLDFAAVLTSPCLSQPKCSCFCATEGSESLFSVFKNINKNEKTKMVVWDAIRSATKPEKKIWTAEIEIYRLVTSNGPSGDRKNENGTPCFEVLGPC